MVTILHDLMYINKRENEHRLALIKESELIVAPSLYIQRKYKLNSVYIPHPDMYNVTVKSKGKCEKVLTIGSNKGNSEMLKYLQHKKLIHLGYTSIEHPNLTKLGPYNDTNVIETIKQIDPDIIWFPSKYPESYCYALSYAMKSGYPIVAHKIGANIERLSNWPYATLIEGDFDGVTLDIGTVKTTFDFISLEQYFHNINTSLK